MAPHNLTKEHVGAVSGFARMCRVKEDPFRVLQ